MIQKRRLQPYSGSIDDWKGVFLAGQNPPFEAKSDTGIDWLCSNCGGVLIRGARHEDQFLSLVLSCHSCPNFSSTLPRAIGTPLSGNAVSTDNRHVIAGTVDITASNTMMVGQYAVDSYIRETGYARRSDGFDLSPAGLRSAAHYLVDLMGDHYRAAVAADERGRASPTPPPRRQRMVEVIDYALRTASQLERRSSGHVFDAALLAELSATAWLMRRWQNHPAWASLAETLAHATEQQHTLMTLMLASYFVDGGNGVGLVEAQPHDGRIADIWLRPSLLDRVDVELKTPLALRGPRDAPLTADEATAIVRRVLKKAGSSKRGQMDASNSGILALGAFHLAPDALRMLEAAAVDELSRQAHRKPHIAGISVSELRAELGPSGAMSAAMQTRLVRHPGYTGALEIADGPWR